MEAFLIWGMNFKFKELNMSTRCAPIEKKKKRNRPLAGTQYDTSLEMLLQTRVIFSHPFLYLFYNH